MIRITTQTNKKVYFASDQHFGAPTIEASLPREEKFVNWLSEIKENTTALFLLGDLFDFWFDYKTVTPKGFVRVLGKLAEFKDAGIPIYFFVGNHDLWMKDYLTEELNIPIYHEPKEFLINNKLFFIGHGDGLGPGDKGYKRMKKIFTFPLFQWMFRWLHPDIGVKLAQYLSVKNKLISGDDDAKFLGEENEWLAQYCQRKLTQKHYDYFIFGHRHLPLEIQLNDKSTYINLGDWIKYFTFGTFSSKFKLEEFNSKS
ncbi:UDP-2,3-diacylglucosamine diphosphatase [Polaribacter sp.]|nr:UDP-2,3-diacylglucosamine diphosphatase [Polaribacter sp.]